MRMLAFAVTAVAALVVAYSLGLGGAVGTIIALTILFIGGFLEVVRPLLERLRG